MKISVETTKTIAAGPSVAVNHGHAVEGNDDVIWIQLGMCQVDMSLADAIAFVADLGIAISEAKILTESLKKARPKEQVATSK